MVPCQNRPGAASYPGTRRHIPPFVSHAAGKRTAPSVPRRVLRSTAPSRCAGLQSCSSRGSADWLRSRYTDRSRRPVISTRRWRRSQPRTSSLTQQISDREREIADAQTVAWLEEEARQLGYVFPGEKLYVIVPPGGATTSSGGVSVPIPTFKVPAPPTPTPSATPKPSSSPSPSPSHGPTPTPSPTPTPH